MTDASLTLWKQGARHRAVVIGGGILVFILVAGIHAPLVDAGILKTPYIISFAFLAIAATMSYQLAMDSLSARHYEQEIQQTRQNLNQLARASMLG